MEQSLGIMSRIQVSRAPVMKKYSSAKQKTADTQFTSLEPNYSQQVVPQSCNGIGAVKLMTKKIQTIEQQQLKLKQKCQQIISQLTREIEVKQKKNVQLQQQVCELREQLQSSREDMTIIVSYLNRKKIRESRPFEGKMSKGQRGCNLDSTKDSGRIQKQISGFKPTKLTGSASNIANYKVRPTKDVKGASKLVVKRNKSDLFDL